MEHSDVNPLWLDIFDNDVILRKIENMISYADLKALRLASPLMNEIVLLKSKFVSRTTFNLTEKAIFDKVLVNIGFPVQQVAVPLFWADCHEGHNRLDESTNRRFDPITKTWNPEDLEHVYEKLKGVRNLTFEDKVLINKYTDTFILYPNFKRILQSASCLKKLKLVWTHIVPTSILDDIGEEVFSSLENLSEIEIIELAGEIQNAAGMDNCSESYMVKYDEMIDLSPIKFGEWLCALMMRCINTLERIVVLEANFWKADIANVHFPKLKEVGFRFEVQDALKVLTFLRNHSSQLTSISVRVLGVLPRPFMELFEEVAPQLRVLRIELTEFADPVDNQFAFLRNCNRLEDFALVFFTFLPEVRSQPHVDTFPALLANIPSSVRKLRLRGLSNPLGTAITADRIHHLSKLKSLTIHQCGRKCDNNALKVIFENLTSLQELNLSGLSKCTDQSFTGLKHDGLTKLTIEGSGITDNGLLNAFKFRNLEYLAVSGDINAGNIENRTLEKFLDQNPALAVLKTSYRNPSKFDIDFAAEQKLKERFPRFCRLEEPWYINFDADEFYSDRVVDGSFLGSERDVDEVNAEEDDFVDVFDDIIGEEGLELLFGRLE